MIKFVFLAVNLVGLTLGDDILTVASNNGCTQVANLIQTAGLADALISASAVTLFAPSDEAFSKVSPAVMQLLQQNASLLEQVLKFHTVPQVAMAAAITNNLQLPTLDGNLQLRLNTYSGRVIVFEELRPGIVVYKNRTVVTAEGSTVSKTDLAADNGVVHVIDKVIFPLPAYSLTLTLDFNQNLQKFAYLMEQAQLEQELASQDMTVFAPTDAAFDKISGQEYNDWLSNLTRMQEVVRNHIVPGVYYSSGLSNYETLTSISGLRLNIRTDSDTVEVNKHRVTMADIPATNGVIHAIVSIILL